MSAPKYKPGTFRATCRLTEFKTAQQMTPEEHATATAAGETSRWDRKAKAEVWTIQCNETFDDAAAFDRHMAEQHGRKPTHRMPMAIPVRMWKGPRARPRRAPSSSTGPAAPSCARRAAPSSRPTSPAPSRCTAAPPRQQVRRDSGTGECARGG